MVKPVLIWKNLHSVKILHSKFGIFQEIYEIRTVKSWHGTCNKAVEQTVFSTNLLFSVFKDVICWRL